MKTKFFLLVTAFLFSLSLTAQIDRVWVRTYEAGAWDEAHAVTTDPQGNVYVTGYSYVWGTSCDIVTLKYTSSGILEWAKTFNDSGPGFEEGRCITFYNGNLYVAGFSAQGGGIALGRFVLLKYTPAGDTVWTYLDANTWEGTPTAMKIDQLGNIILAGYNGSTNSQYVTMKIDTDGHLLWFRTYDNYGPNELNKIWDMCIDNINNIYVTGQSDDITNFYSDIVTIKYNSEGDSLWVKRFNGPGNYFDIGVKIRVDNMGSVYIGGKVGNKAAPYNDFELIKYDTAGNFIWHREYNNIYNTFDEFVGMGIDNSGNIYEMGVGQKTNNNISKFIETIKYKSNGDTVWTSQFDTPNEDEPQNMIMDDQANLYITGYNYNPVAGRWNGLTCSFDSNGVLRWFDQFNGLLNKEDDLYDLTLDNNNNLIVTGRTYNDTTVEDYVTIKYSNGSLGIQKLWYTESGIQVKCYPNPFISSTTITWLLPQDAHVVLKVYDFTGHEVKTLVDGRMAKGEHIVKFDATGLPAGVYFYQLRIDGRIETKKMIMFN